MKTKEIEKITKDDLIKIDQFFRELLETVVEYGELIIKNDEVEE